MSHTKVQSYQLEHLIAMAEADRRVEQEPRAVPSFNFVVAEPEQEKERETDSRSISSSDSSKQDTEDDVNSIVDQEEQPTSSSNDKIMTRGELEKVMAAISDEIQNDAYGVVNAAAKVQQDNLKKEFTAMLEMEKRLLEIKMDKMYDYYYKMLRSQADLADRRLKQLENHLQNRVQKSIALYGPRERLPPPDWVVENTTDLDNRQVLDHQTGPPPMLSQTRSARRNRQRRARRGGEPVADQPMPEPQQNGHDPLIGANNMEQTQSPPPLEPPISFNPDELWQ